MSSSSIETKVPPLLHSTGTADPFAEFQKRLVSSGFISVAASSVISSMPFSPLPPTIESTREPQNAQSASPYNAPTIASMTQAKNSSPIAPRRKRRSISKEKLNEINSRYEKVAVEADQESEIAERKLWDSTVADGLE